MTTLFLQVTSAKNIFVPLLQPFACKMKGISKVYLVVQVIFI